MKVALALLAIVIIGSSCGKRTWQDADKDSFRSECLETAKKSISEISNFSVADVSTAFEEELKTTCECSLADVMAKYPNPKDVLTANSADLEKSYYNCFLDFREKLKVKIDSNARSSEMIMDTIKNKN